MTTDEQNAWVLQPLLDVGITPAEMRKLALDLEYVAALADGLDSDIKIPSAPLYTPERLAAWREATRRMNVVKGGDPEG